MPTIYPVVSRVSYWVLFFSRDAGEVRDLTCSGRIFILSRRIIIVRYESETSRTRFTGHVLFTCRKRTRVLCVNKKNNNKGKRLFARIQFTKDARKICKHLLIKRFTTSARMISDE